MSDGARVFISCGQATEQERGIARDIAQRLKNSGYEPYVAVEQQTLRGLKENIFQELGDAEYLIFVDFRREQLTNTQGETFHRGSLFSHQELAIAAFREIEVIAFRENGVELNGISKFIQANAKLFSDRSHLPEIVADEVNRRHWDAQWRNELSLLHREPYADVARRLHRTGCPYWTRFWHVPATNRHRCRPATNCYAYLIGVRDLTTGLDVPVETIEFKWSGSVIPNAIIPPQRTRHVDAFLVEDLRCVAPTEPMRVGFNLFADWSGMYPQIKAPGNYEFTFGVISDNFPLVSGAFRVNIPASPWDAHLGRA